MRIVFYFICFTLFYKCSIINQNNKKSENIDIIMNGDIFDAKQKKIINMGNTTRLVYKDEFKLYIIPRIKVNTENILDKKGNIIGERVLSLDTSHKVFAIKEDDKTGVFYYLKNLNLEKKGKFDIDSLLLDLEYTENGFSSLNYDLGVPFSVENIDNIIVEKYAIKKKSIADVDSIYRYFDKSLKNIDFTFSKNLDKKHDSKLFKTVFISNKIEKGKFLENVEIPKRISVCEFKLAKTEEDSLYETIITKFKNDIKN